MSPHAALIGLVVGTHLVFAAAATPSDYAYTFPITAGGSSPDSAWRLTLTPAVYAWLQADDLGDLEVFNAAGQSVPVARAPRADAAPTVERDVPIAVLALPPAATANPSGDLRLVIDRDDEGRLRRIDAGDRTDPAPSAIRDWLLDASRLDLPLQRIALGWTAPAVGVVARFSIEAGDDLQAWRNVGTATVLVLEQDGARLERRDLPLGGVHANYLRLHRLDDGAPLEGLTARVRTLERHAPVPEREWLRAEPSPLANGATSFAYRLPAALPVDRVRIELPGDNALASLVLSTRAAGDAPAAWREGGRITAFRLRQDEDSVQNDELDLRAGGRVAALRIDSATPLAAAPQLTAGYRADTLVFIAEGQGPWLLAAGSLHARHADYPVEAALASLRATRGRDWQPPLATLGEGTPSGGDAALQAPAPPLPWRRCVLWTVLVAGAGLVAAFAISLLRGGPRES